MNSALALAACWFPTGMPKGPAIGDPETIQWHDFASVFRHRREGEKDGPNFIPARFKLEPDGRHVRRLGRNLIARTAVAMDCETHKKTGELPPPFGDALAAIRKEGWAGIAYTSHNHSRAAPRYRIVLPLSAEIACDLPAVEVVADRLGLGGVLDHSKVGAASLFYLPSAAPGELDRHETAIIDGAAIDAGRLSQVAGALLAERQAEQDRIADAARGEAEARRQAKIAAGSDPDDSIIEKIRSRFDLKQILLSHGYDRAGGKFRHPNSASGSFGADIKNFGGIDRVYSHNATDPLHRDNLPAWCGGVTALDAFDVLAILDFSGDRRKTMSELARRFGLAKAAERKALSRLLFRLIRAAAPQREIESAAFAEGERLGLSRADICAVAARVAGQATLRGAV